MVIYLYVLTFLARIHIDLERSDHYFMSGEKLRQAYISLVLQYVAPNIIANYFRICDIFFYRNVKQKNREDKGINAFLMVNRLDSGRGLLVKNQSASSGDFSSSLLLFSLTTCD